MILWCINSQVYITVVLTRSYLKKLASKIRREYHLVLFNLGVEDHIFEHDDKYVNRKAFKGLLEWQSSFEVKSEYYMIQRLKEALGNADRNDLCEDIGMNMRIFLI